MVPFMPFFKMVKKMLADVGTVEFTGVSLPSQGAWLSFCYFTDWLAVMRFKMNFLEVFGDKNMGIVPRETP